MNTEHKTKTPENRQTRSRRNAGISGVFFACGLRYRANTRTGIRLFEEELFHIAEAFACYGDLYRDFRKIRHDFANYVQTIQLLTDEESRQMRKDMKKEIILKIDALMPRLEQTCAWKELRQNQKAEDTDLFQFMRSHKVSPLLQSQWQKWERQKTYFVHLDEELPLISQAIWKIKDKLECSLEPDEQEVDELLGGCDQFKKQVDVSDPILAALIVDQMDRCRQEGIDFRFKLSPPDTFAMSSLDMLCLYGDLLDTAIEGALSVKRISMPSNTSLAENTAQTESLETSKKRPLVRIRTGSQYGLWHLHLEYPKSLDFSERGETVSKLVRAVTKRYKAKIKQSDKEELLEVDIVH